MYSVINDKLIIQCIIENSFDEIFITDENGTVLHVSPASQKSYNVEPEKMLGKSVFKLEEEGVLSPSISKLVLSSHKIETGIQDTINNRKLVVSAHPIFNKNEELVRVVSFSRDITELETLRKRDQQVAKTIALYEKELKKLNAKQFSLTKDKEMFKVMELVYKVADLDVTVLLNGETGVGKSRIAQLLHSESKRSNKPFIEVNCGAISETLFEAELFGYEKGAFTGARQEGKKGFFELAQDGTILLDEISELPLELQVKFLTVLQNRRLTRVGGDKSIDINCRVICATNKDLESLISKGIFREDLYYRINVIKINIPPLRKRRNELISLIYEFTETFNEKHQLSKIFSTEMIAWMTQQRWSGNVRELMNYIEMKMITSSESVIQLERSTNDYTINDETKITLQKYMEKMEKEFIIRMYQKYPNSISLGKALGISQSTANRKINKYINLEDN